MDDNKKETLTGMTGSSLTYTPAKTTTRRIVGEQKIPGARELDFFFIMPACTFYTKKIFFL